MSSEYIKKGTKKTFNPDSESEFKISRSKIDLFIECPRCFYLDQRLGVSRPSSPPFTLNVAVDALLKKEFDIHRAAGSTHPLMKHYKIDAIPFSHPQIDKWRENFYGIQYFHKPTNFLIFGAIDDIWQSSDGMLHIVDYKATSKAGEVELEDTKWHNQYRRQMEIYQWLFRRNGFNVSDVGYFVYVNGKKDREAFDGKLDFDVKIIPYVGDDSWVEKTIFDIKDCLNSEEVPSPSDDCEFCRYRELAAKAIG